MIESQYYKIIILCPTIRWNKTYIARSWVIKDENVWLVEPKEKLYDYIKKLSNLEAGNDVLVIVDFIIADENLDKRRQSLLELAISGRHKNHYLWLFVLTNKELIVVKEHLKNVKQVCLYIRNEYPRGFNLFK